MIKKSFYVLIFLLTLVFCSCSEKMNVEKVKSEFLEYGINENIAIMMFGKQLSYRNKVIDFEEISEVNGDPTNGGFIIMGDNIYFSSIVQKSHKKNGSIYIYKFNIITNEISEIFHKNDFTSIIHSYDKDNFIYFIYSNDTLDVIDQYDIYSGKYCEFYTGNDAEHKMFDLLHKSDFTYDVTNHSKCLILNNKNTNEEYLINKDTLDNTPEGVLLNKYDWNIWQWEEYNGEIYISFYISDNDFWNSKYLLSIFKYNLHQNKLYFQNIYYINDYDGSQIYINMQY